MHKRIYLPKKKNCLLGQTPRRSGIRDPRRFWKIYYTTYKYSINNKTIKLLCISIKNQKIGLTTLEIPRTSPIQVLIEPSVAWLGRSDGMPYFQRGMVVSENEVSLRVYRETIFTGRLVYRIEGHQSVREQWSFVGSFHFHLFEFPFNRRQNGKEPKAEHCYCEQWRWK